MKKIAMLSLGFLFVAMSAMAQVGMPIIKTTNAPNKDKVSVSTVTFNYPAEDIEMAVMEKLKKEGLSGKKAKAKFVERLMQADVASFLFRFLAIPLVIFDQHRITVAVVNSLFTPISLDGRFVIRIVRRNYCRYLFMLSCITHLGDD